MYNFVLAFVICAVVYIIGELVATVTKAWVPSVFVTAVVLLIGYWTVIPKTVVSDSVLIPFGSSIGIYLLITHMGTVISLKQLKEQWRTIVVCLAGLAGMMVLGYFVGSLVMDRDLIIAGLPPLTGGIIAATMMQTAAQNAGSGAGSCIRDRDVLRPGLYRLSADRDLPAVLWQEACQGPA